MPYIKQEDRHNYDPLIARLVEEVKKVLPYNRSGQLNYILTKLLKGSFPQPSYSDFNSIDGVLGCCQKEFYRRFTAPYEDEKKVANGDI